MDQKPNIELVLSAISALYNNPDASEKEHASQWLGELQKSVYAWTVADELLHKKKSLESCYFGAQTMRTKIQTHFHELPVDVHSSLRDSLLEHIAQITESTNTIIVTQLCLALADLALQMPFWPQAALDLINRFSQTNTWALLEILTVLPEELDCRSVRLGENRRMILLTELKACGSTVHQMLLHYSHHLGNNWHQNLHAHVKILRCFMSWVNIGAITLQDVSQNIIVSNIFAILRHRSDNGVVGVEGALHDAASDCLCTLLHSFEDNNNQEVAEIFLFNNVISLEESYHLSVANEEQEKSMNYCRIFTELAESFLERIINNENQNSVYFMKVFDLVLICVGHHEYEVAEVTFHLWYTVSEELYDKNNKEITEKFRPYIGRLITALCRHCQIEPDHECLLEDGDDFKDFRYKVSDLIKDIVFIVGSISCFRQMFINLQASSVSWESSEAALFIMQAVAKSVLPSEDEVVPKVVEAILSIPDTTHIAVKYTSILLLGELCEWIEKHPQTLDAILNVLIRHLPQSGLGSAAATALENICVSCNEHMARHLPVLLHIFPQVDTFAITNNSVIDLLKGIAAIMSCMKYDQQLPSALRDLCFLQLTPLCQLIKDDIVPVRGTKSDPTLWLDRLASVLRFSTITLPPEEMNPCKPVILEIWPILCHTVEKYQNDSRIMERCCRCIKYMLRCVSQQLREILPSLAQLLTRTYAAHTHSCFLYVGSILVDEYAHDNDCIPQLVEMLQTFLEPTFVLLQVENGLRDHPDTVDDFFRLCARFLQRAPTPFLQSPSVVHILQCALSASTLEHKEANATVMKFFCDLINVGKTNKSHVNYEQRYNLVNNILIEYGQQLVTNLLHASIYYIHTYMLSEVADVFVELMEYNRELTTKWLANGLDTLPKESTNGIISATSQQLTDVHTSLIRSDSSKSVTRTLKDLTRLYR